MEKEEVLKQLTDYLEEIASLTPEQNMDIVLRNKLIRRGSELRVIVESLNSCDLLWFEEQYNKWINEVLNVKYKDRISEIKNILNSLKKS